MAEFEAYVESEDVTDRLTDRSTHRLDHQLDHRLQHRFTDGLTDSLTHTAEAQTLSSEEQFVFTPPQPSQQQSYGVDANNSSNNSKQSFQQRNTWLRSSLRRSGSSSNNKRISSSAHHANQLFRSSPTNGTSGSPASRRSSLSCESDEMTNDPISLEEDVLNLTQQIQILQDQVKSLTEGQLCNDDRYTRVKQENANLLFKIHSLEEQLRELEIQSDERRKEEQKRFKDAMARHERDKSQENEQYINRLYSLQQELLEAKEESRKFQNIIERLKNVKLDLEEQLQEKTVEIDSLRVEISKLREVVRRYHDEDNANTRLIEALNQELNDVRKPNFEPLFEPKLRAMSSSDDINMLINSEMEKDLKRLKDENQALREANEELQALLLNNRLEEGRILLKEGEVVSSLANEMGNLNLDQLRVALKEQQDVNVKLRSYIDGILLNIVENYPQLLEVKSK